MTAIVTGDKKLDRQLNALGVKISRRINAKAVRAGLKPVQKAVKSEAPKGPTGNLKRAVGARFRKKRRAGTHEAIVGTNVGRRLKQRTTRGGKIQKANSAPHGHLVVLGTQSRVTKTGANRGAMPGNNFVDRGFAKSKAEALRVMTRSFREQITQAEAAA